ncbi:MULTISPECIES: lipopolysaccharide biosynthesis protein [Rothia]|jgi:putative transporter|uniref:lipopolysaccharide biosynthesis protein n=1 Tax=Rothia TaxID=32207 RepID=UPI0008A54D1E|nr:MULTISPECIES: oligosaccharide flippase family protein [Rothia]OFQ65356.1 multidrug transporter MATE [Rothia sp. HMSC061E04]
MTKNQSPRGLETTAVSAFDDAYSTGGHPSRRARLRESGEYVEPVVEQADSLAESSADEFAPTVDDIRSGRFPATTALSIVPPARGFASEESLPDSVEAGSLGSGTSAAGSSAANATAVAGAHLAGSRRVAPATAESANKVQCEKTDSSVAVAETDSASAKSAPVKKTPGKGKQPSLAKSGSLASLCVMYGAGIAFVTTMVVSNGIGAEGSGEFFRLMALFAISISLVTFGADTGLVRTMSAQRALGRYGVLPQLIRYGLIPSLVTSVLLVAGVYIYTELVPMAPEYQAAMRVSSAFILVAALMTVFFGALRGLHRVVTFTLLQNVLLPTLRFAAVGLVVLFSGQLMDLVYAWTVPVAITAVVALWRLERAFPSEEHVEVLPSEDSPTETFRSFWGFSSARGVATVVETILEWIDVLVVAAFLGAAAGGVYGAVNRCVRVGAMIEHTGRVVTGPSISAALATRQLDRAREIFLSTTRVLTALSWPFYLSLAFFGPVLLGFFGKGFEAGAGILWVICPAAMLSMSAGGVQSVLLMSGKSRWQLLNKLSSLVVAVTLNFTLVPVWGLYGAVTAWASALLIDTFLASYQVFRLVGIRASLREMAPSLFLGAAVPTACALVSLTFLGQSVLGLIVYVVLLVPVYGAVLYRFRKALGIERFLSARRAKS